MRERVIFRYSACFRQQVVAELESGRFGSSSGGPRTARPPADQSSSPTPRAHENPFPKSPVTRNQEQ